MKNKECPYCNARVIGSAVIHEPNCPTWDMYSEEPEQSEEGEN